MFFSVAACQHCRPSCVILLCDIVAFTLATSEYQIRRIALDDILAKALG